MEKLCAMRTRLQSRCSGFSESSFEWEEQAVYGGDDKRKLRELKRAVKRRGNKHRRNTLKRQLHQNPEEAHVAEEEFGGKESRNFNGLDRPVDGSDCGK